MCPRLFFETIGKPLTFWNISLMRVRHLLSEHKKYTNSVQWIVSCLEVSKYLRRKFLSTMASRKFVLNLKNSYSNVRNLTIRTSTLCSSSDSSKKAELSEVTHTGQVNSSHSFSVVLWFCYANNVFPWMTTTWKFYFRLFCWIDMVQWKIVTFCG